VDLTATSCARRGYRATKGWGVVCITGLEIIIDDDLGEQGAREKPEANIH
jgi:hypothetical protein